MTASATATRIVPARYLQGLEEAQCEAIAVLDEFVTGADAFGRQYPIPPGVAEAMGTLVRRASETKTEMLRLTEPGRYTFGGPARFRRARVVGGSPR
jgi:hypothetical protein